MRSRPQIYPRLSFHIVRTIAFISASIVTGILVFFCIQLKNDGFKLPWTFIIVRATLQETPISFAVRGSRFTALANTEPNKQVLAASLLSLISLFLTSILYSCFFLSPLFSLILNVTITLLWLVGYILLTWNMYGALGHSCSRANWASDDGMMICRTYKALYSFALFSILSQIALVVLDIRSRRAQTKLGSYGKMAETAARGGGDVKLDSLHKPTHSHASSQDAIPYGINDYSLNDSRRALTDAPANMGHSGPVRMDEFNNSTASLNYDRYVPQIGYSNAGYGYGPQR